MARATLWILGSFLLPITASAATYVIKTDGTGDYPTIEAALAAVNAGDRIELTDGNFFGPGNRDLDFGGKAVTLISQSGDPSACVIDCGGSAEEPHRGFVFQSAEGAGSVLEAITIRGAYMGGNEDTGGAILCKSASPTIRDCRFESCYATYGGGLAALDSSSPNVSGCEFVNNGATRGGALYLLYGSSPAVTSCTFRGNRAERGGAGFFQFEPAPVFAECAFLDNTSTGDGAALYSASDTTPDIAGCLFASNIATGRGGALFCSGSRPSVRNSTLYDNRGTQGGGIFCWVSSTVVVENTIIAFGGMGEAVLCMNGGVATLSCSDLFGNAGGDWVGTIEAQESMAGNLSSDPKFCDAGLGNFALFEDSPCAPTEPCGLIGAFPAECGNPATVITSWGSIKRDFR